MKTFIFVSFGLLVYTQASAQTLTYEQQIQPKYKVDLDSKRAAEQAAEKKQALPNVAICNQNLPTITREEQLIKEIAWCSERISTAQNTLASQKSSNVSTAQIQKTEKGLMDLQAQKAEKEAALAKLKSTLNK